MNTDAIVHVAELYYLQGMNQADISKMLGVSRPTISRFLSEARKEGIVDIAVHNPLKINSELSKKLRDGLKLKNAIVVKGKYAYKDAMKQCAEAAASFLPSIIQEKDTLGIAWGDAMNLFCRAVKPIEYPNAFVAQMAGCLSNGSPHVDGVELAMCLSEKLGCGYSNINSPLFLSTKLVYDHMMEEVSINSAIMRAANADITITGIGAISARSLLTETAYVSEDDMKSMRSKGAVAQILAHAFDNDGNEVQWDDKYVVAAPLSTLANARWSIGISIGAYKAEAAIASIRAGFINAVVVDESLAEAMLKFL